MQPDHTQLAVLMAFLASFQFAASTLMVKRGLQYSDSLTGAVISIGTSAAVYWVLAPFMLDSGVWRSPALWIFAAIGLLRPSLSTILAYEGVHRLGPTVSATVESASPLFAVAGGVLFLSETLGLPTLVGTLGVVLGLMVLSYKGKARREWTTLALLFPLSAAMIRAGAHVGARWGLNLLPNVTFAGWVAYNVSFLITLSTAYVQKGRAFPLPAREALLWFVLSGAANAGAIFALNTALMVGEVVLVSPLTGAYPLFTLLFSWLFFRREKLGWRTVAGVFLVVPSVALITMTR